LVAVEAVGPVLVMALIPEVQEVAVAALSFCLLSRL
jgi:hypothetical protein